jgi:hypothetical protein
MAFATGVTRQYCQDILAGIHLSADVYKIALALQATATNWNTTLATYVATQELATSGGYTQGGITLPGTFTITLNAATANITWVTTQPVWTSSGAGFTADCCLIYNSSRSNKVVCVLSFGSATASGGGTFTVTLPAVGTGTIQIATT